MQKEKDIKKILGDWKDNSVYQKFAGDKNHKFLDRDRTLQINWSRLHSQAPEILLSENKLKILDVACGNGATMEIFKYYGHDVYGLDFSPGFSNNDWIYKPMINSQNLNCKVHDCSKIPYPFKDKSFDYIICYGAITFFKPISNWPDIMDEFSRLSTGGFLVGVNVDPNFDEGEKYLDKWTNKQFKLDWKNKSIYKWSSTKK